MAHTCRLGNFEAQWRTDGTPPCCHPEIEAHSKDVPCQEIVPEQRSQVQPNCLVQFECFAG